MIDSIETASELLASCLPHERVTYANGKYIKVTTYQLEAAVEAAFRLAVHQALGALGIRDIGEYHDVNCRVTPESMLIAEVILTDGRRAIGSCRLDYTQH